jgi:hypothetical protein
VAPVNRYSRHRREEQEGVDDEFVPERDGLVGRAVGQRVLMPGVVLVGAAGAASAIVPAVERALNLAAVVGVVLAVIGLVVAAVRRELRIRRRLAAIGSLDRAGARGRADPGERVLRADAGLHTTDPDEIGSRNALEEELQ